MSSKVASRKSKVRMREEIERCGTVMLWKSRVRFGAVK